jgi:hypothetical protein
MEGDRKISSWPLFILGLAGIVAAFWIAVRVHRRLTQPIILRGAVIKQDNDTRKQSPIANVVISSPDGLAIRDGKSDFSGGFAIALRPSLRMGQPIRLSFRHPDFLPLDLNETLSNRLYVVRMTPLHGEVEAALNQTEMKIGNIRVRYSTETMRTENIGSAVKTFQVVNSADMPCNNQDPCSPDKKWKAQVGSESLDAGEGNVFRDARVICIAGPCAFTRIDTDGFSRGGRTIKVTVRDWSDTTTFLIQAEVFRSQLDNIVRQTYPVIFGRSMNFTLPSTAVGPSIEADMNGGMVVFPLGPAPILSWATCQIRIEKNLSKDYRCELKNGYAFQ